MSQYFENDQRIKSKKEIRKVIINGQIFEFITDNGVFSKKGLDYGTRVLLSCIPHDITGSVLDIGCGYGPIGIYISKIYGIKPDMVDVNERGVELAKANSKLNKVSANIFISNAFENINKKYDYIITNPPIRVGKNKLYEILFGSMEHLMKNGKLFFVINKDQGAKTVLRDLNEKYKTEVVKKDKSFFIICVSND